MKPSHICRLSFWGSLLTLLCIPVAAAQQGAWRVKQHQHPLKQMAISTWRKFLNEDALYIITDQERTAAKELTTDQQRDDFITAFWERRNPNPRSPENAFKEEHYRRIAYANEDFGTDVREGWKTDRGRIYIIYGQPNYVEYPHRLSATEIWHYASVQGLGQNVVLTFTDKDKDGRFPLTDEDVDSHPRIRGGQTVVYY